MTGLPMAAIAADMHAAAAKYAPEDMWQVLAEAREWPEVSRLVAMSVRAYAQRLEAEYPITQAATDKLGELYEYMAKAAAIAEEIEPTLRGEHQPDIDRKENPRGGREDFWNV